MGRPKTNMEAAETLVFLKYRGHLADSGRGLEQLSNSRDSHASLSSLSDNAATIPSESPQTELATRRNNINSLEGEDCSVVDRQRVHNDRTDKPVVINSQKDGGDGRPHPASSPQKTWHTLSSARCEEWRDHQTHQSCASSGSPSVPLHGITCTATASPQTASFAYPSPYRGEHGDANWSSGVQAPRVKVLPARYTATPLLFRTPSPDHSLDLRSSDEDSVVSGPTAAKRSRRCSSPAESDSSGGTQGNGPLRKQSSLFPKPSKERSLSEIIYILAHRHAEDYFMGWAADRVLELPLDERPTLYPVTPQLKKDLVSKSVLTENKKLAFAYTAQTPWGDDFRRKLQDGTYKTLSDAKRDASALWRQFCPGYDGSRAVRMRDDKGNIVLKRTRAVAGSEFEYRQGLRKAKVISVVDEIWARRGIIAEALQEDLANVQSLLTEIASDVNGYEAPQDRIAQLADIIAHRLQRELAAAQQEK